MLRSSVDSSSSDGLRFWATCFTIQGLSDWGVEVSIWLHATDKEKASCNLKGRNALPLACGAWHHFAKSLQDCELSAKARMLHSQLKSHVDHSDCGFADQLMGDFHDCRAMMLLRVRQAFSFWDELPFAVLRMGQHLVIPSVTEDESRKAASELMSQYAAAPSKASLGVISWFFLGNRANKQHILTWLRGGPLHGDIVHELLSYSSSLVVMQRLESRHHLVNMAVGRGRAQLPCATVANLRKVINRDLGDPKFRELLPTLLDNVTSLLPSEVTWNSRKELLERIYGYGLDQLHPDATFEEAEIEKHTQAMVESKGQKQPILGTLENDHLKTVFKRNMIYAIPADRQKPGSPLDFIVCKVISLKPSSRMYLQRVCQLAVDEWQDSMSINIIGHVRAQPCGTGWVLPHFTSLSLSNVNTLPIRYLFQKGRWRGLHVYTEAGAKLATCGRLCLAF